MSDLRYVYVGALALLIFAACNRDREDTSQRPPYAASRTTLGGAPSLDSITHLRITLPESRMPRTFPREPWVITEPRTVSALIGFVTRRDSLWRSAASPAAQSSDPVMFAHYYRGPERVATVALKMDQLGIQGQLGSLVQPLSFPDAAAFLVLVGAPIKVVPVPPRDTMGRTR
jgi:hypothetical protein